MKNKLQKLFDDIVLNPTLRQAILHPDAPNKDPFYKGCLDFVSYQRNLYPDDETFKQEGFMIRSPWHGNAEKAPILFLSSNPAITPRCFFPRWHPAEAPQDERFSLGGLAVGGILTYLDGEGREESVKNFIGPEDIMHYLVHRFQTTRISSHGSLNVWVVDSEGRRQPKRNAKGSEANVQFWNRIRDIMGCLLGIKDKSPENTRLLMKHVLSTEIIPFGSMNQYGVTAPMLRYCWKTFTQPLLDACCAEVFVLLGAKVRDVFCQNLTDSECGRAVNAFKTGGIYFYNCGNMERKVVSMPHPRLMKKEEFESKDFFGSLKKDLQSCIG